MCVQQLEHRQLPAGATIVKQGDIGEEFFVVLRGVVAVFRDSNSVETQVAELRQGASFGELALIEENSRRKATCICKEECSFAVIHKRVYDECVAPCCQGSDRIHSLAHPRFFKTCKASCCASVCFLCGQCQIRLSAGLRLCEKRNHVHLKHAAGSCEHRTVKCLKIGCSFSTLYLFSGKCPRMH